MKTRLLTYGPTLGSLMLAACGQTDRADGDRARRRRGRGVGLQWALARWFLGGRSAATAPFQSAGRCSAAASTTWCASASAREDWVAENAWAGVPASRPLG